MLRFMIVLLASAAVAAGCSMAENSSAQTEGPDPIYFEAGEDPGQLYYEYDPMGMHILPEAVAVSSAGDIYILEPHLRRIQKFDSGGEFIDELATPGDLASSEESYPAGLALDADDNPCVLWATYQADTSGLLLNVLRYDSGGGVVSRTELIELPEPVEEVRSLFIDEAGFVWIEGEWSAFVFTRDGYFNARIEGSVLGFDPRGKVVVRADALKLFDRNGVDKGTLEMVTGDVPEEVFAIGSGGLVIGRSGESEETQTDTTLEYTNEFAVYRLEPDVLALTRVGELSLSPTKYRFPSEESDLALAEQVYLLNTSTVVGDTVYILAYSEEEFWIERKDVGQFRK